MLSEVLPHYSQWRYTYPRDRDTIASLALGSGEGYSEGTLFKDALAENRDHAHPMGNTTSCGDDHTSCLGSDPLVPRMACKLGS